MKRQRGATMVEFAIIGLLFFMLLFGIIEFGRAFFTYNTLLEATRRGARVAAVCPVSSDGVSYVKQVTMFNTPTASPPSTGVLGLTANNIRVKYYNSDMSSVLSSDSGPFPSSTWDTMYGNIAFVEVSLTPQDNINAFKHALYIPLFFRIFNVGPQTDGSHSAITTVLPSGSLGRVGNTNPVVKRCCPGNNYAPAQACTTSSPPT